MSNAGTSPPNVRSRRELIAETLFQRISTAGRVAGLRTSSRRLRHFDQVDLAQMPALFQTQKPETQERGAIGLPAKRTMHFEIWIFTGDAQADSVVPSRQLNNIVDAVEAALAPDDLVRQNCTLGGIVATARIDGSVEYYENVTNDGKSIAAVPVAVLMP